ncbi:MAG: hypothetical protein ABEJ56_03795 [Candidatus Nanohaloarchaea archaeon]
MVGIHARLCGDGYISFYKTNEDDRKRRAIVIYTNKDETNLREFRKDMKEMYGVDMYRHRNEVKVKSVGIVKQIQEKFERFLSNCWRISEQILDLPEEKKY